jgi:hemerythrin
VVPRLTADSAEESELSKVACGEATISMELMEFLKDWLAGHVKGTDKNRNLFSSSMERNNQNEQGGVYRIGRRAQAS